ncbi:MAG: DNA repair protein RadC [Gammaproteobacteria bacterium]|nr:DNA repair protein RadC [Gammaproteobacteria bacterium]
MSITDWPLAERPREKLLANGSQSLTDAELLAIFLRTGIRGKTAVDLSNDLLEGFSGLRQLLKADQQSFCQHHGLGTAKYAQLQAVLEMARRYLNEGLKRGDSLTSPQETRQFLSSKLRDYTHEVFAVLFLDQRHRVIRFDEMFRGTIDGASVYPREVVKKALEYNAAAVIFAHNHPSGVAEPSQSDERITQRLKEALGLVDIRVLDHFVVGDDVISFAERGLL